MVGGWACGWACGWAGWGCWAGFGRDRSVGGSIATHLSACRTRRTRRIRRVVILVWGLAETTRHRCRTCSACTRTSSPSASVATRTCRPRRRYCAESGTTALSPAEIPPTCPEPRLLCRLCAQKKQLFTYDDLQVETQLVANMQSAVKRLNRILNDYKGDRRGPTAVVRPLTARLDNPGP